MQLHRLPLFTGLLIVVATIVAVVVSWQQTPDILASSVGVTVDSSHLALEQIAGLVFGAFLVVSGVLVAVDVEYGWLAAFFLIIIDKIVTEGLHIAYYHPYGGRAFFILSVVPFIVPALILLLLALIVATKPVNTSTDVNL